MSSIEKMRARHKMEITALQENCPHKDISGWMPYHWAPGHYAYDVKVCEDCGKTVESTKNEEQAVFS